MTDLSVLVCTHNPRRDYLTRVLGALRAQTLPLERWELVVIDNASKDVLSDHWDLSWHPRARHVRENELGLTPARLRGIAESTSELLVFVDDDNVLSPNYLETALQISEDHPFLGAWGGTIEAEFEVQPEPWLSPIVPNLGIRAYSRPIWSNNREDWAAEPCGAGLCIRSIIAKSYSKEIAKSATRRKLDRVGQSLSSAGDTDLIHTSCDLGKGFGNFPQLSMKHLIPANRVTSDYLIRLMKGVVGSRIMLQHARFGTLPNEPNLLKVSLRYVLGCVTQGRRRAQLYWAGQDAIRTAIRSARGRAAE